MIILSASGTLYRFAISSCYVYIHSSIVTSTLGASQHSSSFQRVAFKKS